VIDAGKVPGVRFVNREGCSVRQPVFGEAKCDALIEANDLLNVVKQIKEPFSRSIWQMLLSLSPLHHSKYNEYHSAQSPTRHFHARTGVASIDQLTDMPGRELRPRFLPLAEA
jgi:hypothetical protein